MRKQYKYLAITAIFLFFIIISGCTPIDQPDYVDTSSEIEIQMPEEEDKEDVILEQPEEVIQMEEPKTITIAAVGDIMCHKANLESAFNPDTGKYDFTKSFEYVKEYIDDADLAIANFETVTAGEEAEYTSFPYFNTPDSILEALRYAGFHVLVTANNHALDRKKDGVLRTIEKINEHGMVHVGTLAKPDDKRFLTIDVKDFKISIIAYSYSCNGNSPFLNEHERTYMLNLIDEEKMKEDIKSAREIGSDIIIAYMHWGNEYHRTPSTHQEALANKIFDWGADIILGTHPHVIQKSEILKVDDKDRYIIYSMGNFISNFRREDQGDRKNKVYTEDGVIVRITLEKSNEKDENQTIIKSVTHIPTWVDKYFENGRPVHKILPVLEEDLKKSFINDTNREKASASYNNTMELMTDYQYKEFN